MAINNVNLRQHVEVQFITTRHLCHLMLQLCVSVNGHVQAAITMQKCIRRRQVVTFERALLAANAEVHGARAWPRDRLSSPELMPLDYSLFSDFDCAMGEVGDG